eukprot:PhF_6_TR34176/c0_g1_i1/m.50009
MSTHYDLFCRDAVPITSLSVLHFSEDHVSVPWDCLEDIFEFSVQQKCSCCNLHSAVTFFIPTTPYGSIVTEYCPMCVGFNVLEDRPLGVGVFQAPMRINRSLLRSCGGVSMSIETETNRTLIAAIRAENIIFTALCVPTLSRVEDLPALTNLRALAIQFPSTDAAPIIKSILDCTISTLEMLYAPQMATVNALQSNTEKKVYPKLKYVSLGSKDTLITGQELVGALPETLYPGLSTLHLDSIRTLTSLDFVKTMPQLESLSVRGCRSLLSEHFEPLRNHPNLHHLDISNNRAITSIAFATSLPQLHHLCVSRTNVVTIPAVPSLQLLDAEECQCLMSIENILATNLVRLNVSSSVNDPHFGQLEYKRSHKEVFHRVFSDSLVTLNLYSSKLATVDAWLERLTNLESLHLGKTQFNAPSCFKFLKPLTNLLHLDLTHAVELRSFSIHLPVLQSLHLGYTDIRSDSLVELAELCPSLIVLMLNSCKNVSSLGFVVGCNTLRVLDVRATQVGDEDLGVLEGHPSLQRVNVFACRNITSNGMDWIASKLEPIKLINQ